jgi:hypothetical protein
MEIGLIHEGWISLLGSSPPFFSSCKAELIHQIENTKIIKYGHPIGYYVSRKTVLNDCFVAFCILVYVRLR